MECVILLHGLARTANSMHRIERILTREGYYVVNVNYPSRKYAIETLAPMAVNSGLERCQQQNTKLVNYVTHSLGGILVRYYYQHQTIMPNRVVMLGPPNQGSELVDKLRNFRGYVLLNGPAGLQLGTGNDSFLTTLDPVNFKLGVIAGNQSINLFLSTLLSHPNDGKVSVESTKVAGMCSFVSLPTTHPFMMGNTAVIQQTVHFLKYGEFDHMNAVNNLCKHSL
ncbi:MAG TPA: alpha/beta hydrolase [Gammaproteobacteria bacterium]|nr:alpha/beta hydrolase [Gammaproteobacteria bacterium]